MSSQNQLVSLSIEHLRGAVVPFTLPFEKGKRLTIVYGENGSGKSTICDALDLLGNGNVGSLDGRGLGSTKKYWAAVGKSTSDIKVTLNTTAGMISAVQGRSGPVAGKVPIPRISVLRRSSILRLLEAKPADRYQAISQFIDVSGIEASEDSLRSLQKETERVLTLVAQSVYENNAQIEKLWIDEGKPGANARVWAKAESTRDVGKFEKARLALETLVTAIEKLERLSQNYKRLNEALKNAIRDLTTAQLQADQAAKDVSQGYMDVLELLTAADRHFSLHPKVEACPLCESKENADGLAAAVKSRLTATNAAGEWAASKKVVDEKIKLAELAKTRLDDLKDEFQDARVELENAVASVDLPKDVDTAIEKLPLSLAELDAWVATCSSSKLGIKARIDKYADSKKFATAVGNALSALLENEKKAKKHEVELPLIRTALEVVSNERKKFSDGVLQSIALRVSELYERVHPGEGLNKIVLELDAAKRASLEISTEFASEKNAPPQAYFSDSHLDTLGLCVYLALAERESPESTLIVLDDVLASVDEPHVERIIEMLYGVAGNFRHCLITTHYGPWRHKYRWGWLKNGECQFIELTSWSISKGITALRSIPPVESLRSLLASSPPDPQLICAKAGVVLEAVLDFLTALYECSVPRRPGGVYTLGDLLPAISGKLKAVLRVEHKIVDASGATTYVAKQLEPHLAELLKIAQARNVIGCHFNRDFPLGFYGGG
jgi:energy-coupling factor transporter ATP-binding protein EcfA2